MRNMYRIQLFMLFIVGVGALFGGGLAIYDPSGVLYGMPVDVLKNGPFTNFLIPGLFLFFIIGIGHLTAYTAVRRRLKLHPYISGAAGSVLMGWILIQCYVLRSIHYLHIIFFMIGLLESIIALYMLVKLGLYPLSRQIDRNARG